MKKRLAVDIILDQYIWFGGELMTRRQVRAEMEKEGHEARCIDFFTFYPPAVTQAEIDEVQRETAS